MKFAPTLFAGMLFLFSCSNEPADEHDRMEDRMENIHDDVADVDLRDREKFESDRQEVLDELRELRDNMNEDLSDSEKKLAKRDLDADGRSRQERLRSELLHQRSVVERHIEKVENAGIGEWENVRMEMRNSMNEAQLFYDREGMERRRSDRAPANPDLDLNRNARKVR